MVKWTEEYTYQTIDELIELIDLGLVTSELKPSVLIKLGENYDKKFNELYHTTFGKSRTERAKEIFPPTQEDETGWKNFLKYLNSKISVNDSKTVMLNLTREEREYIRNQQALFNANIITQESLNEKLTVRFKSEQISRIMEVYFKNSTTLIDTRNGDLVTLDAWLENGTATIDDVVNIVKTLPLESSIDDAIIEVKAVAATYGEKRKRHILSRVKKLKSDINEYSVNLAKGNLFENMVGIYLAHKFDRSAVDSQSRKILSYTDFNGIPHREMYLDYLLNDEEVIEVKWKNNFLNIIDSILPQLYAASRDSKKFVPATVICREKSKDLLASLGMNLTMYAEWKQLELDWKNNPAINGIETLVDNNGFTFPKKSVNELFNYTTFEEYIKEDKNKALFLQLQSAVDSIVATNYVSLVTHYNTILQSMFLNGENLLENISLVIEKMTSKQKISNEQIIKFGKAAYSNKELSDKEHRQKIVSKRTEILQNSKLTKVYNTIYKTAYAELSYEMLRELSEIDENSLEKAVLELSGKNSFTRSISNGHEELIRAVDAAYKRQQVEKEFFISNIINKMELLDNGICTPEKIIKLKEFIKQYEGKTNNFATRIVDELKNISTEEKVNIGYTKNRREITNIVTEYETLKKICNKNVNFITEIFLEYTKYLSRSDISDKTDLNEMISLIDSALVETQKSIDRLDDSTLLKWNNHPVLDNASNKLGSTLRIYREYLNISTRGVKSNFKTLEIYKKAIDEIIAYNPFMAIMMAGNTQVQLDSMSKKQSTEQYTNLIHAWKQSISHFLATKHTCESESLFIENPDLKKYSNKNMKKAAQKNFGQ